MLSRLEEMAKLQGEKISDWKTSVNSRGKEIQLLKSKISQIQKVIKTEEKVSSTNMDSDKSPSTSLNTDTSPSKHVEATCEPDTSTANVMDVDNSEVLPTIKEHLTFCKNAKIHINPDPCKTYPMFTTFI